MSFGSIRDFTTWMWMVSRISDISIGLSTFCALDRQHDLGVRRAAHLVHRVVQRHADQRLAVQRGDDVARLDAGAGGGRVIDRGDDLDDALVLIDLDPEAAEFALGLDLHVLERFGVHVGAVRIETGQHAVDRVLDQVLVIDRIDVFGADALHHVAEHLQHLVHVGVAAVLGERAVQRPQARTERGAGHESGADQQAIAPMPSAEIHAIFPFGAAGPLRGA